MKDGGQTEGVHPLNHGLFGLGGKVVSARVAVLGFEGVLPVNAFLTAARADYVRRQQDRTEHFLFFRTYNTPRNLHYPTTKQPDTLDIFWQNESRLVTGRGTCEGDDSLAQTKNRPKLPAVDPSVNLINRTGRDWEKRRNKRFARLLADRLIARRPQRFSDGGHGRECEQITGNHYNNNKRLPKK